MYALKNCRIFTGDEWSDGDSLAVDGNVICRIAQGNTLNAFALTDTIDLCGAIVAPGFLDLQVNGGGGRLFNSSPDKSNIERIYAAHRKCGTVAICPTFITDSMENLCAAIDSVGKCDATKIPAIHIEGFFISKDKCGIHSKHHIRTLDVQSIEQIISAGSCKKLITLAPEVNDVETIKMLSERVAAVFGGHSNADYETFMEFLSNGGAGATHLFNAMSQMQGRLPGVCGAVLNSKSAIAGIIVDGHHVDYACVSIAKRIMGGRLFLVSDAMPPACSDITEYDLYGEKITVSDGVCVSGDGVIAGSCLSMAQAVKNSVVNCDIELGEAIRMASLYPAQAIDETRKYGRLYDGALANITVLSQQLLPVATIVNGEFEKAYAAE